MSCRQREMSCRQRARRLMVHAGAGVILTGTLALAAAPSAALAATFTVNRSADQHDFNTADPFCDADPGKPGEQCTLRAGVEQTNAQPGKDRLLLPAKAFPIKPDVGFGDLTIEDNLVIDGERAAKTVIRLADPASRIFTVDAGAKLDLRDATVRDGVVSAPGAGILNDGSLVLRRARLRSNEAIHESGGAIFADGPVKIINSQIGGPKPAHGNLAADGGGIFLTSSATGKLVLRGSSVRHNAAVATAAVTGNAVGGGIAAFGVPVTIERSQVSGNLAEVLDPPTGHPEGGGIYADEGELSIDRALVAGNTIAGGFGDGAGIRALDLDASITRTTVRANTGEDDAGGGGISYAFAPGDMLTLKQSTVTANTAPVAAGVLVREAEAGLENVTLSENVAGNVGGGGDLFVQDGSVTANHLTVLAASHSALRLFQSASLSQRASVVQGVGGLTCVADGTSSFTSLGFNVEDSSSCNFNQGSDRPNADPGLGPLKANGGPTHTHALRPASTAINRVAKAACPPPKRDQRGVERPGGKRCDAGAYERK